MTERPALDRWLAEADELIRGGDPWLPDGMRCAPAGTDLPETSAERRTVSAPSFGFDVVSFGADPTGMADSTSAINNAIAAAAEAHRASVDFALEGE